jgi:hypothetical protein
MIPLTHHSKPYHTSTPDTVRWACHLLRDPTDGPDRSSARRPAAAGAMGSKQNRTERMPKDGRWGPADADASGPGRTVERVPFL